MKRCRYSLLIMATAVVISPIAQSASANSNPSQGSPEAIGAKNQRTYCLEGWERFLPGDYYACRARYHLDRKHFRQTVEMLKEAAYWANKDAQHALGLAYINGDIPGFPANRPLGIAWLALAAERKNANYVRDYSITVLQSAPSDISSASKMYVALSKTYGDHVAGKRATDRFTREVQPLDSAATMGGNFAYINALTPLPQGAFALSKKVHEQAKKAFKGLQGTVSIGVLERIEAPKPALRNRYKAQPPEK
jgi:hypothetical protein